MDGTEQIRAAMRDEMQRRGWTQARLAQELGVTTSAVAQILNGHYGKVPQSLLKALEALDLELTAQPKKGGEVEK